MILSAQGLSIDFAGDLIFCDANFDIEDLDRVGLIGANGTGKTTLFRIITGEIEPTTGNIFISKNATVGTVEQHACTNPALTAYQETLTAFNDVIEIEKRLEKIRSQIELCDKNKRIELIEEQDRLIDVYIKRDGLTYKARAKSALLGLGLTENEINLRVSHLSGGQKTKVSLAKLLLSNANLILLDEPTNHLDINSVEWLEDFLKKYNGTAIIISHDRYFLDKTTTKTIEIEHNRVTMTNGNYSRFMHLKQERLEFQRREYLKTIKEIKRIEGIIAQQVTFSQERNYITIASKQKQIDRLKAELVKPESEEDELKLSFPITSESGNDVLFVENVSKSFGDKKLFDDVNMNIYKGERVFLVGPNGCGKSTLLKIIMGKLTSDTGRVIFGHNTRVGYFEQVQTEITSEKTVLDEVYDRFPKMLPGEIRKHLAAFQFRGDDVFKRMCDLSGGERAKVALLVIMLRGANVLLLDEPTNHLDVASAEHLERALSDYKGTIICASHDRYFINKLASRIFVFASDEFKEIEGNYDTYKSILDSALPEKSEKVDTVNDYKLRKEAASLERKRQTCIAKIEAEIVELEEEINFLSDELKRPEISSDYIKITEITDKLTELQKREDELFLEWEELNL
jgi:ATP-binding cassette subfamily F protein 3